MTREGRMDGDLYEAIRLAEQLRAEHNGVGGVYLFLGHDGHHVCKLKDGDAREVGAGESGRSLLEAVRRADADRKWRRFWRRRSVTDVAAVAARRYGADTPGLFATANFLAAVDELAGETGRIPGGDQATAMLEAERRVVRVSPTHWLLLPSQLARYAPPPPPPVAPAAVREAIRCARVCGYVVMPADAEVEARGNGLHVCGDAGDPPR